MRSPLPLLALLTLAAAASAQTVVLSPVDVLGFEYDRTYAPRFTAELGTAHYYQSNTSGNPGSSQRGWRAEFDLSGAPPGLRVVSARLATRVVGAVEPSLSQAVASSVYAGTGTVPHMGVRGAPHGNFANFVAGLGTAVGLDTTTALQTATGRYIGFVFYTTTVRPLPLRPMLWEAPTLTVVYGPPVRIPLALGDFRGDVTKVPVTVQFRLPGTTEVVSSAVAYPDAAGAVEVGAAPGTYDVSIRADRWLRRILSGVEVSGPLTLPAASLVNGDVDGNNAVSATDRARVTAALGRVAGQTGFQAACDLDGNGVVNAVDRAIVTAHLGSVGDN